jgi:hypothetical protein
MAPTMAKKRGVPKELSAYLAKIGSKGGKAKTTKPKGPAALSPERRQEIARKAAAARWKNSEK